MRPEEFNDRLHRGAADVAAQAAPPPAGVVRRRGDRHRTRNMLTSGLLAFAIGAGGGGFAYASFSTTSSSGNGGAPTGVAATETPIAGTGRPGIVAVTTAGQVDVLNQQTGLATTTLTGNQDVVGDEIAVSRNGVVYFAVHPKNSCTDEIESVPLSGGTPASVASGVLPAISPDGADLAFAREALGSTPDTCGPAGPIAVVVLNLDTHAQTSYPAPPGGDGLISVVSHLSWAPGGAALLVSSGPVQDNEGWELNRLNIKTATYYLPENAQNSAKRYVPAATAQSPGSYFEEGVYLPDGNLFADRVCCAGVPVKTTSNVLEKVTMSGTEISQVALGYLPRRHGSLDAAPGWLLYISGTELFIVADGHAAKPLSNFGFIAATWVP
jgi:hypothetical protein